MVREGRRAHLPVRYPPTNWKTMNELDTARAINIFFKTCNEPHHLNLHCIHQHFGRGNPKHFCDGAVVPFQGWSILIANDPVVSLEASTRLNYLAANT